MSLCTEAYGQEALKTARRASEMEPAFRSGSDAGCRNYGVMLRELKFRLDAAFNDITFTMRREPSVEACVACWEGFVELCDAVSAVVQSLRSDVPQCGSSTDFDFILDLRTEAFERAEFLRPQ